MKSQELVIPKMVANFHSKLLGLTDLSWQCVVIHDNSEERPAWTAALLAAERILGKDRVFELNQYVRDHRNLWVNGHAAYTALKLVRGATIGLAAWEELSPAELRVLLSPFNIALHPAKE